MILRPSGPTYLLSESVRGGMGVVYLAQGDPGTQVAIKLIRGSRADYLWPMFRRTWPFAGLRALGTGDMGLRHSNAPATRGANIPKCGLVYRCLYPLGCSD